MTAMGALESSDAPGVGPPVVVMPPGYRRSRALARLLGRVLFSWRVSGTSHVPAAGGFVVACNHASYVDPPLVGAAAPRCLRYMAKRELFDVPFLSWVIRSLGALPVKRGGVDRQALQAAADFLAAGGGVLIFPAGSRRARSARPGASLLAATCQVPVVPARIERSDQLLAAFLWRRSVTIQFGEPIPPPPPGDGSDQREVLREHTAQTMAAIERLGAGAFRSR